MAKDKDKQDKRWKRYNIGKTTVETYSATDGSNVDKEEPKLETYGDPVKLETYDAEKSMETYEPVSLSNSNFINEGTPGEEDTSKSKAARFMGFIRGKWDDLSDRYREKIKTKSDVYGEYMTQAPSVIQTEVETKNTQKINMLTSNGKEKKGDNWAKAFSQISTGLREAAGAIPLARMSPSRVMGFKGTVLGPLPQGTNLPPPNYFKTTSQGQLPNMSRNVISDSGVASSNQRIQDIANRPYVVSRLQEPGVEGAQVPKYTNAPKGAPAGTVWTRVQKYDKYGKKRSYLRKVRAAEASMTVPYPQQQQRPMPSMTPNPYDDSRLTGFMGVSFTGGSLSANAALAGKSPNPATYARGQYSLPSNQLPNMSRGNIIDMVKTKAAVDNTLDKKDRIRNFLR